MAGLVAKLEALKLDENLVLGSLGGTQDLLEAENAISWVCD
ncbi:MAG: hypothetical protein ACJZ9L_03390 [Coraliomargaritaceae bacterium]